MVGVFIVCNIILFIVFWCSHLFMGMSMLDAFFLIASESLFGAILFVLAYFIIINVAMYFVFYLAGKTVLAIV